jgi:hypothetical protein
LVVSKRLYAAFLKCKQAPLGCLSPLLQAQMFFEGADRLLQPVQRGAGAEITLNDDLEFKKRSVFAPRPDRKPTGEL